MIISETQLRCAIRNILRENQEKMYASKLAKLIGSGDYEDLVQGIELGEGVDMIHRYYATDTSQPFSEYYTPPEKIVFFHLICHKELAASLREEIESKPDGSNIFGFIGCNPGHTNVEYPDMPDFCKISFRMRLPAALMVDEN